MKYLFLTIILLCYNTTNNNTEQQPDHTSSFFIYSGMAAIHFCNMVHFIFITNPDRPVWKYHIVSDCTSLTFFLFPLARTRSIASGMMWIVVLSFSQALL